MVSKLKLRNFKCYREAELGFAPLTVFAGMNAVGKSTVLQALLFLRQSMLERREGDSRLPVNGRLVSFGQVDDLLYAYGRRNSAHGNVAVSVEFDCGAAQAGLSAYWHETDASMRIQKQILEIETLSATDRSLPLFSEDFAYLCADRVGPRTNFKAPTPEEARLNFLGNQGEFCAWHLADRQLSKLHIPELLVDQDGIYGDSLIQQVSAWMSKMGRQMRVSADMNERQQSAWLAFSFLEGEDGYGLDYSPSNVGFGLTYSLPIFVALLALPKGGLALIENPEAHLHPKGQVAMGMFLSKVAANGIQVVVETHSDHILNGMRLAVKKDIVRGTDVRLNFVAKGDSERDVEIATPRILQSGAIDVWPEGFFDEYENTIAELI